MRQAMDSGIIRLTMDIREHKPLEFIKNDEVQILPSGSLNEGMLNWADQILTTTNFTRHSINDYARQMRGYGPEPCDGDKIICLRNYWDYGNLTNGEPLVNGSIGTLLNPKPNKIRVPYYAYRPGIINVLQAGFISELDEDYGIINMDPRIIQGGESELEWRDKYKLGKLKNRIGDIIPKEFAYGYAITAWKAQGSEWDRVLAIEEDFPYDKETHYKCLYTMATRGIKKLVIIKKD